ncbi:MAG: glycosyltransferase, partial [Planctomycetota bacterium]
VRSWASQSSDDWHLVIAGHDQRGHQAELEREIEQLGLGGRVTILGPQVHDAKADFLAAIELFVLPTDWENFGVVVGESLAAGVPVVTTTNTPWRWLNDAQAGWCVEPTQVAVDETLADALRRSRDELADMGERGRQRIATDYSWSKAVEQLAEFNRQPAER